MTNIPRPQYTFDKRWKYRRAIWRRPGEVLDPSQYGVEVLYEERTVLAFLQAHHYEGTLPPTRLCVGLYRKTGVQPAHLAGVAVFSNPMQEATIPCYTGFPPAQGTILGRFALLDEVPFNGESWFLRRAFASLWSQKGGRGGIQTIVSYADPMERRTPLGHVIKPAHAGQIYQGHNALFAGRSSPRVLWLTVDGQVLSERSLSKIRNHECGHESATQRLLALGADARRFCESPGAWIKRVLPTIARRVRHPGNFVYVFGLTPEAKEQLVTRHAGGQPYPKLPPSTHRDACRLHVATSMAD